MPAGEKTKKLWANKSFKEKMSKAHRNQGVIHGFARRGKKNRFYNIFTQMKGRCESPKSTAYKWYGGRGRKCERKSFKDFHRDMFESYKEHVRLHGERQTTIDRINNDGNYSKKNCRWATRIVQGNNISKTIKNKSGVVGIHYSKESRAWHVAFTRFKKFYWIGRFKDFAKAKKALSAASREVEAIRKGE